MRIGSFDLGVKHLAFVIVELFSEPKVVHVCLSCPTNIVEYMDSLPLDSCDVILIERQMNINRKAFALQHQILTYLQVIYGPFKQYFVYNSKKKTEMLGAPKKQTYAQRKKFTVEYATNANVPFVDGYKKDDVADAYCQAIAFIKELL
jgi:hypothetical protein